MRKWCGTAVEVSDQAQQERNGRRRSTLSACRRVAVLTLTLVLVAGVHVAWAPATYAAPAEFVEQRITLNGHHADLTLERVGADYAVSINYLDEAPARFSVTVQQTLYDSTDGDLMSCVDTSWSDNVSLDNGRAVFTPTIAGQHATLDLGELPLRSFQRVFINLETSAATSVVVHAVITDNWGTRHELRSPSRPIAAGTSTVNQNITYMIPSGSTRPDGLNRIHSLGVSVDGLDPVTIHSVVLTAPSVTVRPGDEDLFQFAVPISPSVAFDMTVGDATHTLFLEELVGAITVADVPQARFLFERDFDPYDLRNMQFVNISLWFNDFYPNEIPDSQIVSFLRSIDSAGWDGVSLDYFMFVDSLYPTRVIKSYSEQWELTGGGLRTATPDELEKILRMIIGNTDLLIELRPCLFLHPERGYRGFIEPRDLSAFFDSFYNELLESIQIANRYGVSVFTPLVELESLEVHASHVHRLLDRLDPHFDGWFSASTASLHYTRGGWRYENEGKRIQDSPWQFLGWHDSKGRRLIIGPNIIVPKLSTSLSYTRDSLLSYMLASWEPVIAFYRSRFPESIIWFGEFTSSQRRGTVLGWESSEFQRGVIDHTYREMADCLYAMITGSRLLGVDGFSLNYYSPGEPWYYVFVPDEIKPEIEALLE